MLILGTTTDKIQVTLSSAITTNQLDCIATYKDITTSAYSGSAPILVTTNNTTAVDLVPAPGSNTQRIVDFISIYNNDTANATVIVTINRNGSIGILFKCTLKTSESLVYSEGAGWNIHSNNGSPKQFLSYDTSLNSNCNSNIIINGNPTINQRGYVSGTATSAANQYTLDRWRVVVSGQSITWTDSNNVRTVTAPAGGVEQVIEGGNLLTDTYTLSWTGTATATVAGASVTNGGNVSITGGTNTTVRFSSGTFSLVQFEQGSAATPFHLRSIGEELALCQRYYFARSYAITVTRSTASLQFVSITFPVQMRATPTSTYSGFIDNDSSGATGMSFSSLSSTGATGFAVTGTTTAGARLIVNTFNNAEL